MGTKGTWRRPAAVDDKELEERWAAAFPPMVFAPTPENPEVWNIWDGGPGPEVAESDQIK